jgi:hypothetical protein
MREFLTFQRFNDRALADDLIKLLQEKGIEYEIGEDRPTFDATVGTDINLEISVKIRQEDFNEVNELLLKSVSVDIDKVEKGYYLFEFSDEELVGIISKPDEWSHYDYSLASQILKKRGKEINVELAAILRKNRVQELKKHETGTTLWIVFGYGLVLIGGVSFMYIVTFVGLFIGMYMATNKKVLPNGDKVYAFSESDRTHGLVIAGIGIIALFISLGWMIYEWVTYNS